MLGHRAFVGSQASQRGVVASRKLRSGSKASREPGKWGAFGGALRRSAVALAALSLGSTLASCQRAKSDAKKPDKGVSAASASAAVAADDSVPVSCQKLEKKLCEEAGDRSSLCESAQATFKLLSSKACTVALEDFDATLQKIRDERKVCSELVTQLCSGIGPDTETCKMVTEKTKEFPAERCEAMLKQVDEIIVDLKKQEMANQPLTKELQATIAAPDAPSFGPADAKVTIVEFSDFECPYCSKAANVVHQLKEQYGTKVRFVFRQFPLSFHRNAQPAAEAALAAHAQGKFWDFHDRLFANQRQLDKESLRKYAKEAGLNLDQFDQALEKGTHTAAVQSDLKMGENVAVQGTPTMFINGERVGNPTDFAAVSKIIDKALGS